MAIEFVDGDLFTAPATTLAHGVSCAGRMGAGIALEFRRRFPEMFQEYRRRCYKSRLQPGDLFLWKQSQPWILNMATQATTGGAKQAYVEKCLQQFESNYRAM